MNGRESYCLGFGPLRLIYKHTYHKAGVVAMSFDSLSYSRTESVTTDPLSWISRHCEPISLRKKELMRFKDTTSSIDNACTHTHTHTLIRTKSCLKTRDDICKQAVMLSVLIACVWHLQFRFSTHLGAIDQNKLVYVNYKTWQLVASLMEELNTYIHRRHCICQHM